MYDYGDFGAFDTGMRMNSGMGVYTAETQLNFDVNALVKLGFTWPEIDTLQYLVCCGQRATVANLTKFGLSYEEATRIKYMYDIVTGRVSVDSEAALIRHLKKMFGGRQKIGINSLKTSTISVVPRKAVIGGIPNDNPFCIYNSVNRKKQDKMYPVVNITAGKVYVQTGLIPKLPYGHSKKLIRVTDNSTGKFKYVSSIDELPKSVRTSDGYSIITVAEIKELKTNDDNEKKLTIAFDAQYAKVCNRFIIVGSLKRPEFHHGMVEIICIEGTKVYVFAKTAAMSEIVKYSGGTQRVYDFGYVQGELQPKLIRAASEIYKTVSGVCATSVPANSDFIIIPKDNRVINDEDYTCSNVDEYTDIDESDIVEF